MSQLNGPSILPEFKATKYIITLSSFPAYCFQIFALQEKKLCTTEGKSEADKSSLNNVLASEIWIEWENIWHLFSVFKEKVISCALSLLN